MAIPQEEFQAVSDDAHAVIEDATLGAEAEAMFLADLEQSREITMRSRVIPK